MDTQLDMFAGDAEQQARISTIRACARDLSIVSLTYFPDGITRYDPEQPDARDLRTPPLWTSWRESNHGGASGPHLGDFEAAALIADGTAWHVFEAQPNWYDGD